jgi:DNA-binding winged helix-turn-helix (wHTH) protein/Flp pilus assembly protein TadD
MAPGSPSSNQSPASSQRGTHALHSARFAEFEVDFEERLLRRNSLPVKIQKKPFEILRLLLERPGTLVTRARIAQVLWPDLHVSYERSLNTAVNALRECLGDSGRSFRFIETCSGVGYRFIARVEAVGRAASPTLPNGAANEAHRDYLTGMFFYNKMSEESLTTALAHFESAILQDPSFALPYAGLAQVYTLFAFWGILPPGQAGKRAEEYARSALWLAPDKPEPYVAMAGAKRVLDWDWAGAERLYRKALDLDPHCEQALVWLADLLLCQGRVEEAVAQVETSLAHDPLSQWAGFQRAWTLLAVGDARGALEQAWRALVLDSNFALGHFLLGLIYQRMEMVDEALTELDYARSSSPSSPIILAALGHVHATSGAPEQAQAALEELTALSQRRYVSPYCLAVVHAGLDDRDSCVAELERALNGRDIHLQWMYVDPRLSSLRCSDDRIISLLNRMGLQRPAPAASITPNKSAAPS